MTGCAHPCPSCGKSMRRRPSIRAKRVFQRRTAGMGAVVDEVASFYGFSGDRLANVTYRDRETCEARQVAAWMLCELFPRVTLSLIASLTGYRERSGPSHAVTTLERRMGEDDALRASVQSLRQAVAA